MKPKKVNETKKIVLISLFSAMAYILSFFSFSLPIPFIPQFLKIDLSELPIIIAAFVLGPISGIIIEGIKNVLALFNTSTGGIGELANFLIGSALIIGIFLCLKIKNNIIIGMIFGTLLMIITACILNYFVLIPLYVRVFFGGDISKLGMSVSKYVLVSVVLFNTIKGVIVCMISYFVYKLLKKNIEE